MQPFLKTVALEYYNRYKDLSNFTFIFPNKRSGIFFLRYLKEADDLPIISPAVKTISEFVEDVTGTPVDNKIDLLFKLFMASREIVGEGAEFEKFRSFGDTVLNDFNEVDMWLVDPEELFQNIKNLNNIRANYETPEIKEIKDTYFNYPDYKIDVNDDGRLWKKFHELEEDSEGEGKKKLEKKFVQLWNLLFPLYIRFHELVRADGMNTTGGNYRRAAEKLSEPDTPLPGGKFVFVGFNALTASEKQIFRGLQGMTVGIEGGEEAKADFIWDISNKYFTDKDNPASRYVLHNSKADAFPSPAWWREKSPEGDFNNNEQKIKVISVPSNVAQMKIIRDEIEDLAKTEEGIKAIEGARVAVVLPDDSYLPILLNSLPTDCGQINLTMGYSLKYTPVMSFLNSLRRLQTKKRSDSKEGAYFLYNDLKRFLIHPFSQLLFDGQKVRKYILELGKAHRMVVSYKRLCEWNGLCEKVLKPLSDSTSPLQTMNYIKEVLTEIGEKLEKTNSADNLTKVDLFFVSKVIEATVQMENSLRQYGLNIHYASLFTVFDRMIGTLSAAFKGEPLGGLQIMGLLETRNLDFDYVYMPGLNDKVMPRSGFTRTFIPNHVRFGFGMPPSNFPETLFAYYFYRLLGKSRQVVLTYDSRATDNLKGSVSRYVLQLKHLFNNVNLQEVEARFSSQISHNDTLVIPKDERVAEVLEDFKVKGKTCKFTLSSTALGTYCSCPVKFMFRYIQRQKIEEEPIEAIDALEQGDIIHDAILNLYLPDEKTRNVFLNNPVKVTESYIRNILENEDLLISELKKSINRKHYHLEGEAVETHEMEGSVPYVFDTLLGQLKNILRYDLTQVPFQLVGCEFREAVDVRIDDDTTVRMVLIIDRLDYFEDEILLRIVDYKTGKVHLEAETTESIFNGEYKAKNMLQLLLYGYLLKIMMEKGQINALQKYIDKPLSTVIYDILNMADPKSYKEALPTICDEDIRFFNEKTSQWFSEGLKDKIGELFNLEIPFVGSDNKKDCEFCEFKIHCEATRIRQVENP